MESSNSNQLFSLKWNNYLSHIMDAFEVLRNEENLVDVTLSCDGLKIKAHKMLLSACSSYFKDLFKDNPCQHPIVVFKNVKYLDLRALIDFIYQGEVNVMQDQLPSFLATAKYLQVKGLADNNFESAYDTPIVQDNNVMDDENISSAENNMAEDDDDESMSDISQYAQPTYSQELTTNAGPLTIIPINSSNSSINHNSNNNSSNNNNNNNSNNNNNVNNSSINDKINVHDNATAVPELVSQAATLSNISSVVAAAAAKKNRKQQSPRHHHQQAQFFHHSHQAPSPISSVHRHLQVMNPFTPKMFSSEADEDAYIRRQYHMKTPSQLHLRNTSSPNDLSMANIVRSSPPPLTSIKTSLSSLSLSKQSVEIFPITTSPVPLSLRVDRTEATECTSSSSSPYDNSNAGGVETSALKDSMANRIDRLPPGCEIECINMEPKIKMEIQEDNYNKNHGELNNLLAKSVLNSGDTSLTQDSLQGHWLSSLSNESVAALFGPGVADGSVDAMIGDAGVNFQVGSGGEGGRNDVDSNVDYSQSRHRFICKICGATYKHLRNLRAHCHLHYGKTRCNLCNKVLCNISYYKKHLQQQHGQFIAESKKSDIKVPLPTS